MEKELKDKQRLIAYKWAYEKIYEGRNFGGNGMCIWLRDWVRQNNGFCFCFDVPNIFEEFNLFNPGDRTVWFDDNKKGNIERLTVLSFCIAMIETALSTELQNK